MPSSAPRRLGLTAAAVVVSVLAALLGTAAPAQAADATITVGTTADGDATGACTSPGILTLSSPVTLRSAICVANNRGGAQVVDVPSGSYALTGGTLPVGTQPGADITIQGTSSSTITGDGEHQVFLLDPAMIGGVAVTLDGLTVSGGVDDVYGGGAVLGGSPDPSAPADALVIRNSTFSGNRANTSGGSTAAPGGAVQFAGGSLTVTNSTFTGNDAGTSSGGAIAYQSVQSTGQGLRIDGSTFTGNSATATGLTGGAAVDVADTAASGVTFTITDSTFTGNTVNAGTGRFRGSAILLESGKLTLTGSTFGGNRNATADGSAIAVSGGALTAQYNRFAGDNGVALALLGGQAAATENWWGCGGAPGASGCDAVSGPATTSPYLTLTATAAANPLVQPATSTTVTASLLVDSAGAAVPATKLGAFAGTDVAWTANGIAGATVSPGTSALAAGTASTTFTSASPGTGTVTAALAGAGASAAVAIGVYAPPAIASTPLTGVVGRPQSSVISASGYPTPALALDTAAPAGLSLTDNHDGTATLTGTPTGPAGDYALAVAATNSAGRVVATIPYSLNQTAAFSSPPSAQFRVGSAGAFTITTTGRPTPSPIALSGPLPTGLTFTDAGNGSATIAGTPAPGTGGITTITLSATNGVGAPATQSLTISVLEAPRVTSSAETAARVGDAVSFTVTTAHAYPVPVLTRTGTLPAGLAFTDNGDGTASIAGTPTGPGGSFPITVGATSAAGSTAAPLTIVVAEPPAITLAASNQTVGDGATATFTAAASGFPAPGVQWFVSEDGGSSWRELTGETAPTLSFRAALAQNGNRYRATFTSTAGSASTEATLTVTLTPGITSAAGASFAIGSAGTFTVTTTGSPVPALRTGTTLPSWLGFTDNGDGTATIAGTPPAGSGGAYPIAITAANGALPDATQDFVLTVPEQPAITSAAATTFTVGASGSFTITTAPGYPALRTLAVSGALPSGVRFVDRGDGSGVLTGTPDAGTGGVYALTVTSASAGSPAATQAFVLTVDEAATFTSASRLEVTRGVEVDFAIATGHAYPAVTAIGVAGTLPAGLVFTDNGDGTATITGTTLDAEGSVPLTLTAGAGSQTLTLEVSNAPVRPLPAVPIVADGPLGGVPSTAVPGQSLTVTASGFAADSPVTFGIYSTPVVVAQVDADVNGVATATIVIPAGYTGAHTLLAIGTAPDGSERVLRSAVLLPGGTGGGSGGPGGSGGGAGEPAAPAGAGGGLAGTGSDVGGIALLAVLLLAAGVAVVVRRRVRRA
ncbi:putative Ig domain-containing protein [Leifsonia sp. NPDC080035]|uniref:Ig domain-containing protein n=1 Tax=Leifsonia sp. NPDC080035 TaxID=3143936 RepID=A0AAU7GEN0_9MICO